MRVLVSCYPMLGHLNTVMPVARAALHAGHEVVVATGVDMVARVLPWGLTFWPVGPSYAEAGGVPTSPEFFGRVAEKRAVDLVPRALDWRPDVIVHEETELAGAVAATRTGARHVVHGLGQMPSLQLWQAFRPSLDHLGVQWDVPDLAAAVREALYVEACPPSLRPPGERVWRRTHPVRPVAGSAADEVIGAITTSRPDFTHRVWTSQKADAV
jgi:hypothetical protein